MLFAVRAIGERKQAGWHSWGDNYCGDVACLDEIARRHSIKRSLKPMRNYIWCTLFVFQMTRFISLHDLQDASAGLIKSSR
jgi:hypothetical protein